MMKKRLRKLLEDIKVELEMYNGKYVGETEDDENLRMIHHEFIIKRIDEELGEASK